MFESDSLVRQKVKFKPESIGRNTTGCNVVMKYREFLSKLNQPFSAAEDQ